VRLFVAVTPPPPVLAEIGQAVDKLRSGHDEVRWTRPEAWHVTLAFLGEVGEERLPELTERLGRAARRHQPPTLAIGAGGRFGGRVLWVRVDGDRTPLSRLASSVAAAARRTGVPIQDRPFRPHLTLARSKGRAPVDLRPLVQELRSYSGTPWTARELHLVRSHLGPEAHHEPLTSWPLGRTS
jgi:2'-5' RNA ligase